MTDNTPATPAPGVAAATIAAEADARLDNLKEQLATSDKLLGLERKALEAAAADNKLLGEKLLAAEAKARTVTRLLVVQRSFIAVWRESVAQVLKSVPQDAIHTGTVMGTVYRADLSPLAVDALRKTDEQMAEYVRRDTEPKPE